MGLQSLPLDETILEQKLKERSTATFDSKTRETQLQLYQFSEKKDTDIGVIYPLQKHNINASSGLGILDRELSYTLRLFMITQNHSWDTLNISEELFRHWQEKLAISTHLWSFIFAFGVKAEENELAFPGFWSRMTPDLNFKSHIYESAFILRRVEIHNRKTTATDCPWVIRQSATYHKLSYSRTGLPSSKCFPELPRHWSSIFLLVSASTLVKSNFNKMEDIGFTSEHTIKPWNLYRWFVAESMIGWRDYMAWLEERLRDQSNRLVLAPLEDVIDNQSLLEYFKITFENRQAIKALLDKVIDLEIILPTLLNTIVAIKAHCERFEKNGCLTDGERPGFNQVLDELEQHIHDARKLVSDAKCLDKRANSTSLLLSDLLGYDEAIALKRIAHEAQQESQSMHWLARMSTRDASAVKILTIITLLYLPTTIVANFFSTQFVQVNNAGSITISSEVWLLVATSVPLTAFTLLIWWVWVQLNPTHANLQSYLPPSNLSSQSTSVSFSLVAQKLRGLRDRNKSKGNNLGSPIDIEKGI